MTKENSLALPLICFASVVIYCGSQKRSPNWKDIFLPFQFWGKATRPFDFHFTSLCHSERKEKYIAHITQYRYWLMKDVRKYQVCFYSAIQVHWLGSPSSDPRHIWLLWLPLLLKKQLTYTFLFTNASVMELRINLWVMNRKQGVPGP